MKEACRQRAIRSCCGRIWSSAHKKPFEALLALLDALSDALLDAHLVLSYALRLCAMLCSALRSLCSALRLILCSALVYCRRVLGSGLLGEIDLCSYCSYILSDLAFPCQKGRLRMSLCITPHRMFSLNTFNMSILGKVRR